VKWNVRLCDIRIEGLKPNNARAVRTIGNAREFETCSLGTHADGDSLSGDEENMKMAAFTPAKYYALRTIVVRLLVTMLKAGERDLSGIEQRQWLRS
jgi:hypothetical protein